MVMTGGTNKRQNENWAQLFVYVCVWGLFFFFFGFFFGSAIESLFTLNIDKKENKEHSMPLVNLIHVTDS